MAFRVLCGSSRRGGEGAGSSSGAARGGSEATPARACTLTCSAVERTELTLHPEDCAIALLVLEEYPEYSQRALAPTNVVTDAVVFPFRSGGGDWNSPPIDDVASMRSALDACTERHKIGSKREPSPWAEIAARHARLYRRALGVAEASGEVPT